MKCTGVTKAGAPCAQEAAAGKDVCRRHDPAHMAALGKLGGERKAQAERVQKAERAAAAVLATVEDIREYLERAGGMAEAACDYVGMNAIARTALTMAGAEALAGHAGEPARVVLAWPEAGAA